MKLVFDLYDFGKEESISKEDVRLLLSHAPINKSSHISTCEGQFTQSGGGGEEYTDRLKSQEEVNALIDISFDKKEKLTFEDFKRVTEKVTSEMFLCIFSLVKTHFPSIDQFKRYEQGLRKNSDSLLRSPTSKRRLASPKVLSTFSSLSGIVNHSSPKRGEGSPPRKFTEEIKAGSTQIIKLILTRANSDASTFENETSSSVSEMEGTKTEYSFTKETQANDTILFCECGNPIADYNKLLCANCVGGLTNFEGYLYKRGKNKVKKYWISIQKRELFRNTK
jgi:hypothetical protein